jgi:putative phosphoribosyl transferase
MRAAVVYARRHDAAQVIVAVPCASEEAAERVTRDADRFVCPWVDPEFVAVGSYYRAFDPVSDADVLAILAGARTRMPAPAAAPVSAR